MDSNRIEKRILLRAPLERVWQAISDSGQFGRWFGAAFNGPFLAGRPLTGKIVGTAVDPEVAKLQKPHEGKTIELWVEKIEPMRTISFRWHPFAVSAEVDYSKEPTTLIVFQLEPMGSSTQLTITESGFDQLPLARRAEAFRANDGGWAHQLTLIEKYLAIVAKSDVKSDVKR